MPKIRDREIVRRWRSESPLFFQKITKIMVSIGAIGGAILVTAATLPISIPAVIITGATYCVVAGTVGGTISKLTKK